MRGFLALIGVGIAVVIFLRMKNEYKEETDRDAEKDTKN